jgi:hypothetical protein
VSFLRAAIPSLTLFLCAATATASTPGFAFLEVPAGARAAAMGGAYVTLADGAEAAFWNPAGLALVQGTQVTGSHNESFQNLKHDQFAVAGQLFGGGLAASLRAMYSQAIDQRDEIGNLTGSFGAHDLEFQLGYGRKVGEGGSIGFAAQAVRERIANESATTYSGSVGATWRPRAWKDVRFGVSAQHLGPAAYYEIDGQRGAAVALPAAVQAGGSWTRSLANGLGVTAALDARATQGRQAVVSLGGELASDVGASVRMGVRQGDDLSNFSTGVGWRRGTFRVDYAWVPSKLDLGDTHRFSFATQF